MTVASASIRTTPPTQLQSTSWDTPNDSYTLPASKDRFTERLANDLNTGRMSPEVNQMADAMMWPGKNGLPKVHVKTFAVDGIQAKDIVFIQRALPVPDAPNVVLFIPEKEGRSFHAFKTVEDMNRWLKTLANDPKQLEVFSQHFAEGASPAKKARVVDTMTRYKDNDINAIVGPYANEGGDIFARLDKEMSAPPAAVNGLTHLRQERTSPEGRTLYSGQRADGENVFFEYDAYGNFLGNDKQNNFYFVKDGLNTQKPLLAITEHAFKTKVLNEAASNVGANDIRGLYDELLNHLEHPFSGAGDVLLQLGVNKNTADTVDRYLDNPFSALLLDLNKNNQIGKVFGVDKQTMDSELNGVGDTAQGFVPFYGQARALSALLAKALRNEPMSDQEKRDLADGLVLKPNSPARKGLPGSPPRREPHGKTNEYTPAALDAKPTQPFKNPRENSAPSGTEQDPATPADRPNRLRPSQWSDISSHAVAQGEQLISGAHANARGIYQVKGPEGADRWFIRMSNAENIGHVYEIDGKFKTRDGYVNVIDPITRKTVITVHATGGGAWEPINGPGGIKWPWQSASPTTKPFDPGAYDYPANGEASSSKTREKIDKQLKNDAGSYHKKAETKERPVHPGLPHDASAPEVIKTVYKKSDGMIVGEDHSQSAGLRLLIDNASELQNNQVKTLYSEGFDHSLQADLDHFYETGEFSAPLRTNLKLIDRAHSGHGNYTNRELLIKMRDHGIRVKAIDVPSVEPKSTRLKNMNYYAAKLIESDQAANPQAKWVARVGSDHVFTYDGEPPVRGISELTGATGVCLDTAIPDKGPSVIQSRDKTEIYIEL
ncbi:membrane-targeted effector domain-containing toxin [Pseudomonas sp. PAMC 26793]|uniref:membrane-targeted effector domain-containing toxin n=1 Tax=Pseudomonas sp. PAMC 26793 TaxID=1240676 RepID=UPI0003083250|nr:membrane-targeted effector domain-containing toxin [Pseudomonas sp. PAMC 26793]